MGIARMQKVMIAVHQDEKAELLEELQDNAILHIKDVRESELTKDYPELLSQEEITDKEIENNISLLGRTIAYLRKFNGGAGFIDAFLPQKTVVSETLYTEVISSREPLLDIASKVKELEDERTEINRECGAISLQRETLLPWQEWDTDLEAIGSLRQALSSAGVLANPPTDWKERAGELRLDVEIVREDARKSYILVSYLKEDEKDIKKFLTEIGFEAVNFGDFKGKPKEIIQELEKKLTEFEAREARIVRESKVFAEKLNKLHILFDYYSNLLSQKKVENFALNTETTICIEGWIRAKEYKALEKLTEQFETASLSKTTPEPGEEMPVELENRKGTHIFESITELYASPHPKELDPSPFLAPFFVLFFALCLTDALYGLIFAIMCLFLARKIKGDKKLLWVLFAGGIATIFAGAATGGWCGDMAERFNLGVFSTFARKVQVFNPMEKPLKFFILSLGIGFVQVAFGYFLGFIKAVRQGRIFEGISNKLSWDFFWIAILIFGFSFKVPKLQSLKLISGIVVIASAGLILFGSGGPSRNWFFRVAKGGFNFYQGFMGTISDIISYSRLMALGLVTAGIAMAVNIFVELVGKIPVIGIVLGALIFIGGHLFSVGINVLGAYVHTLRLQYAEFFTKFFEGGGEKFEPFRKKAKYILVENKT